LTALKHLRDIWGVDAPKKSEHVVDATLEVSHVDADELSDNDLARIVDGQFTETEHGAIVGGKAVAIEKEGTS